MTTSTGIGTSVTRDFTVAVFVVSEACVLMHWHPRLNMWLPPGGHIEPHELPDEAAVREVFEETGVAVNLVGDRGLPLEYPGQLIIPQGIQVEDISPGHQHIDLIYYARPLVSLPVIARDLFARDRVGWYAEDALSKLELNEEISSWCDRALRYFETSR